MSSCWERNYPGISINTNNASQPIAFLQTDDTLNQVGNWKVNSFIDQQQKVGSTKRSIFFVSELYIFAN